MEGINHHDKKAYAGASYEQREFKNQQQLIVKYSNKKGK